MIGRSALLLILCFVAIDVLAETNWTCDTPGPIPFKENGKWGYLSDQGIVISPKFDIASRFTKDGAVACIENSCGLISKTGVFITPLLDRRQSSALTKHVDSLNPTEKDGKWGYVNPSGQTIIPFRYESATPFEHDIAKVKIGDKFFFINRTGERITDEFDGVFNFSEDLAAVDVAGKIGYIRRDGSFALPPLYHSASGMDFSEGLVAVNIEGKVGFMDTAGSIIIQPAYDDVYPFSEGLAPVRTGQKWGYIDNSGRLVIPLKYDMGHMFSEGVASVMLGSKGGYIDHAGAFVVPPTFDSVMPFCGGVAEVTTYQIVGEDSSHGCRASILKGKHGFIDHAGHYVWRDAEDVTWNSGFCF
jgi:hypothetical protein